MSEREQAEPTDLGELAERPEEPDRAVETGEVDQASETGEADQASETGEADQASETGEVDQAADAAEAETGEPRAEDEDSEEGSSAEEKLEQEGDIAADYLEELLDIADLDGDLDMDVEGERAVVSIVGAELQQLVGDDGRVLDALQELTRLAVYRETGERSRLMLDISGHRAARRRELEELTATTVAEVKASGERSALRPMTPFERKVVHDAVAAAGLTSESEGVEPRRYVVVLPA